jgi:transposase
MSRYRLTPSPAQEAVLRDHCAHARYVWNLAVEQHSWWQPGRASAPGYLEQCRQLTATRADYPWLAAGSIVVQQQALRDFAQAMTAFFDPGNPAGPPSWRKAGRDPKSRESQAVFRCTACGFACNADVNAARNIAAGHAVTARGRPGVPGRENREPQLALLPA